MLKAPTPTRPTNHLQIPDSVVHAAVAGDEQAFRQIVEAYQRPIQATVERLIGGRYPGEIPDVVQDIFHKIHRCLPRWDRARGASLSTWIYTLVRNFCFDVLKKRRLRTVSLGVTDEEGRMAYMVPDASPLPEESLQHEELESLVDRLVDALPNDQRRVFELRQFEDLNYREIARHLGVSLGTVKSRLARAKESLRRELTSYNLAS